MSDVPSVAGGRLFGGPDQAATTAVGSADWFAWLSGDASRSFSYRGDAGSYTARKEFRARGGAYWVAYRTAGGRQHKVYLGRSANLTEAALAEASAVLAERVRRVAGDGAGPGRRAEPTPAGPGLPLLATKLFVPRPRPDLVRRPRLLDQLHRGLGHARCTVLSAPAGSGKTSLVAAWLAELDRPAGWLALDERDQDLSRFLRYLLAALQAAVPAPTRTGWADGPLPPAEALLTGVINDLAGRSSPAVLVLDDYHVVRTPAVHDVVGFLVDHLPPTLHLVVAGREDPPLPLPRLRARAELVELRAADLGFTVAEATAFLGPGLGLELSDGQVGALVERTEGWAAGLQMAGLALRNRPDPGAFVAEFAGGHRLVADYLSAEVLDRLPTATRRFVAATAALDRLCAPLCAAVLDGEVADSRRILEELDRANLFLVPLDGERTWYRYHHLFADTLRARLAAELDPDETAAVHRRAGAWFGRQQLLPEAIQHALAAAGHDGRSFADAAEWLETLTPVMLASIDVHHAMDGWLGALPDPLLRARPMLCLARAWLLIHQLRVGEAADWAAAAQRALPVRPKDGITRPDRERGAVAAIRALLATLGPQASADAACTLAEQALRQLPTSDVPFRGVAGVAFGQGSVARGRVEDAERALTAAAAEGQAAGLVHGALVVTGHLVAVQRLRGARRRALATGRSALAWAADRGGGSAAPGLGTLSVLVADLLADGNELAEALPLAVRGYEVLGRYADRPPLILLASLTLTRLRLYHDDPAAAADVLARVRPVVDYGPYAALAPLLAASEAMVQFALGETAAAVRWARDTEPAVLPAVFRLQTHVFTAALAALLIIPVHLMVAHGRATGDTALLRAAAQRLGGGPDPAEQSRLDWLRLRATVLRALVADGLGDPDAARAALVEAVGAAEPEGVIRPFLDAGPGMATLLSGLRGSLDGPAGDHLEVLLGAFPGARPAHRTDGLIEPLTTRELDVLRLLAAGRSNAGMAHLLVVGESTIKTHLVHIYGKLGVHSRTQAVARAHALHLLD